MKRIRSAYDVKFRKLLASVHARNIDKALSWFFARAEQVSVRDEILLPVALNRLYESTARKLSHAQPSTAGKSPSSEAEEPIFWCDAGLGGLARWLRATGYDARWKYGIDDAELVREAMKINAVVLTTDSGLMERGILRDGHLRGMWLPPALHIPEQLEAVFREFNLRQRASRCMACGGEIRRGDKEELRERIPPKTYLWLDEYFVCTRCGKLFWHGTHWKRIRERLSQFSDA